MFVQLGASKSLSKLADDQYKTFVCLLPKRGVIYDRNMNELAVSLNLDSLYVDPLMVRDKEAAASGLSEALDMEKDFIIDRLNAKGRFAWICRKLDPDRERKVKRLSLEGIGFVKEPHRVYPHNFLASHVIGFVGMDDEGLEGLELEFNDSLKGTVGWLYTIRDAKQRTVPGYEYREIPPADGNDLVLTIDSVVQSIVEKELNAAFEKHNAKGGSVIVMKAETGDILALANRPSFDPNNIKEYKTSDRRNRAVCDFFEPGSSFKIVDASAVFEEDVVSPDDEFFCENGEFQWGRHVYHDHHPYGWLKFSDVIKHSSNIGTMKSALKLGEDKLYRYIKRFGFGKKTGIELPGEVKGIVRHPRKWSKMSICSISMGQEITVTALQLACAFASIANGGYYMKPRIVDRIQDKTGNVIKRYEPKKMHRVLTEATAREMRKILRGVVKDGTGQKAEVEGYFPAGKTGTAQKIKESGGYSHRKFTASFIGFLPYDDPEFVIAVIMDEPGPVYYGGSVCAPVFQKIADRLVRYYKLPLRT